MSPSNPHALATATTLAERLTDPSTIPASQSRHRPTPQSLANGAAGVALLHIERARAHCGDWATVHSWLSTAAGGDLSAGPNASLFFGAPALAFVTHAAADRPGKLERALADLDTSTAAVTQSRLDEAHARINRGDRPALSEFDLIRGLTGLGAHHLQRDPHHEVTAAVLAYLVRLTEPLPGRTDGLPGWWTDLGPTGRASPDYAGGHGNFGLAHGIAGPLALLSLAQRRGIVVDGHTDAIDRIGAWLDAWRQDHPAGPRWPRTITRDEVHNGRPRQPGPLQPSWCYGTPGLARAQQLAGLATDDTERQRTAEAALLGCLTDPAQLALITDSGLCHGAAGLLHTAWRMASDATTPDITAHLPHLSERLLTQLRASPQGAELLDGSTGAALALHTAATDTAPLCHWDACLLLA
ncbi:MAG: lantibiotic modifying enzyme [Pseudonocardiaceae bacterium]|nr:lantibiotic modifying enzyme [Pseudonocardiaceae bacterium]